MKRTLALTAAALVLLICGYVGGRYAQPARVVEKEKRVEVVKTVESKTRESTVTVATADNENTRRTVVYRTRYIRRPDGTTEATTESESKADRDISRSVASGSTEKTAEIRYVDRWQTKEVEKLVESARPRWSVGASAGMGLDGRKHYGGDVAYRLFGPVAATLSADVAARSMMVGLRVGL